LILSHELRAYRNRPRRTHRAPCFDAWRQWRRDVTKFLGRLAAALALCKVGFQMRNHSTPIVLNPLSVSGRPGNACYSCTPSVLKCKTFRDVTFKIRHAQIFSEFPLLPPRAVSLHRPARSLSFLACFHGAPHFSARVAAPPWRRPSLPLAPHHHRPPHEYPLLPVTPVDTSSRSNVAFLCSGARSACGAATPACAGPRSAQIRRE
jgi:hypothetical protein